MLQGDLDKKIQRVMPSQFYLGLPRDVWLIIYEQYLLDPANTTTTNINLISPYFNSLKNDALCNAITHLLPFYSDLPKSKLIEFIKIDKFFNNPSSAHGICMRYVTLSMLQGNTIEEIMEKLPEFTQDVITKISDPLKKSIFMAELEGVIAEFDPDTIRQHLNDVIQMSKGQVDYQKIDNLIAMGNVNALLKSLENLANSTDPKSQLQLAALAGDMPEMQVIINKLRQCYSVGSLPAEWEQLETLVQTNNLTAARQLLSVNFDREKVIDKLSSHGYHAIPFNFMLKWSRNDEQLKRLTPLELKALINMAPHSAVPILLERLVELGRFDLVPYLNLETCLGMTGHSETFNNFYEKSQDPTIGEPLRAQLWAIVQLLFRNEGHLESLVYCNENTAKIAQKYDDQALLKKYFTMDKNRLPEFTQQVFAKALRNHQQELISAILCNATPHEIPLIVDIAYQANYPAEFVNELDSANVPAKSRIGYYAALIKCMSLHRQSRKREALTRQFNSQEAAAVLLELIMDESSVPFDTFAQLAAKAKFFSAQAIAIVARFLINHKTPLYDKFVLNFIEINAPKMKVIDFIQLLPCLPHDLANHYLGIMLEQDKLKYCGRVENRKQLEILCKMPQFILALQQKPELLADMIGDRINCTERHYDEKDVSFMIALFGKFLDTKAKLRLLDPSMKWEHGELQRQLMLQFPQELDFYILKAHFGNNHHLEHLVKEPSVVQQALHYVSSYIPSFAAASNQSTRRQSEPDDINPRSSKRQKDGR